MPICPQGETLRKRKTKYTEEKVVYRADAAICNTCPLKAACTGSDHGREVSRPFDADYLDRVRGYHQTEAYKRAMRKRKVWIEPLFGEAKQWHGMRQFRLRGLSKVNMEGLMIAAGQNLKRLLSAKGWGRHPWPDGEAGFADLSPQTRFTSACTRFSDGFTNDHRCFRMTSPEADSSVADFFTGQQHYLHIKFDAIGQRYQTTTVAAAMRR